MSYIIPALFILTFLLIIKLSIESRKLFKYLYKNHYETWKKITTIFGIPGGHNSFKSLRFLHSNDDLNDPEVYRLKRRVRKTLKLLVYVLLFITILFVLPILLWVISMAC